MRRIGIALGALLIGSGVSRADDPSTCMLALKVPDGELAAVVKACTDVYPRLYEDGSRARTLRFRGQAFERQGKLEQSLADFNRALQFTPDDHWALEGRARVHRELGHTEEARRDYVRLLQLNPGDTRWRVALERLGVPDTGGIAAPQPYTPAQVAQTGPTPLLPAPVPASPPPSAATMPSPPAAALSFEPAPRRLMGEDPEIAAPVPEPSAPLAVSPNFARSELPPQLTAPATIVAPPPGQAPALIRRLQTSLRELGYHIDAVNGLFGRQTRIAMRQFAVDIGLPPKDQADEALVAAAEQALGERQQQTAARQRELHRRAQQALSELNYDIGVADGVFGPRSRRALDSWLDRLGRPPAAKIDEALVAELERARSLRVQPGAPRFAAASPDVAEQLAEADVIPELAPEPTVSVRAVAPAQEAAEPAPAAAVALPSLEPPRPDASNQMTAMSRPRPAGVPVQPPAPVEATASGERRVALVIGNSAYRNAEPLRNTRRDALDMAKALRDVGFEVFEGYDLERTAMDDKTAEFSRAAEHADLALAYYSGHGLQFDNVNYLVPVDARFDDRRDVRKLVRLDQLVEDTSMAKYAMVVIDACRNDPFGTTLTRSLKRNSRGLAAPDSPPEGTLIAYATASGNVALDGNTDNSPYVRAILRHLKTPRLEIRHMFGKVRDDVAKNTSDFQTPTLWDSLGGHQIFLVPGAPEPVGLALGDLTRSEVLAIQRSLGWLGYWNGAQDGELSPNLIGAIKRWQGLPASTVESTMRLMSPQIVALHRSAFRDRREALPAEFDLDDTVERASNGEAEPQRLMGMIYDPAFAAGGRPKNPTRAKAYYEKAARQGDRVAAARLGLMLAAPGSSPPQQAEARRWLDQAARAGEASAALRLAEILIEEQGDAADRPRALGLLNQAAESPDADGGVASAVLRVEAALVLP